MSRLEKSNARRQQVNKLKDSSTPVLHLDELSANISALELKSIYVDAILEADRIKKAQEQTAEYEYRRQRMARQKEAMGLKDYPKDSFSHKFILPFLNYVRVLFCFPFVPNSKLRGSTGEIGVLQAIVSACLVVFSIVCSIVFYFCMAIPFLSIVFFNLRQSIVDCMYVGICAYSMVIITKYLIVELEDWKDRGVSAAFLSVIVTVITLIVTISSTNR